ncbi:single-stranded-DNA-specific exonuclease RecJ [Fluviicola chungangensis]|uniref:Single-stranded-DNA-specific exonuclease RecJ n=1 Tax=Fluviicola chungangensis TaxID=2597671 RepID=A0A556N2K8_9FLAO|nr:single-stranded-DNA-specific exonuclease RecJ [Fluviicola chungangensis]TSJ46440.1 single-stranded-DNA-specific exonuclease RecJ [Fluviicola chungangensis]
MQKHWFIKQTPSPDKIQAAVDDLKVSPIMAALLTQRELTTLPQIRSFFTPELSDLHDPFLMLHMLEAVERLQLAVETDQRIMIFGDYDVDGTTSVALVYSVLKEYTSVEFYIPDRYEEGYGLSYKGIDTALEKGCGLLIALDCGIKEVEKVKYAKEKGLEIIICDHHTPGIVIPDCIVLDPKQKDCEYPFKELCGCGVGFKLLQAWFSKTGKPVSDLFEYLDLVAIAIGADIVSVTGENRILCKHGIQRLNENPRAGILALVEQAQRSFPLDLSNVVFTIAPRINAAGRLKSGSRAVELLLAKSKSEARHIAMEIDEYNSERRILDAQTTLEALEIIAQDELFINRKSTVVFQSGWHKGVVGIVASRLIEHHYRPTIVLTENKGEATGSARSVSGFNVYEAITACEHLLTQYGGHQHAAGLSLPLENVAVFREHFDAYVQEHIQALDEMEELVIDLEITASDLFLAGESVLQVPRIYRMLEQMEPFGPGNNKPVFCIRNAYASKQRVLKEAHLKFDLVDPVSGIELAAIGFNMADKADLIASGCAFDCAFTLETNTWQNRTTLQIQVRDIRETI